uniref:Uncharacterized protein n=1 Tax=Octopus bimaculoides TaxID=37653 RepID=A0A0L8G694_OCTBM
METNHFHAMYPFLCNYYKPVHNVFDSRMVGKFPTCFVVSLACGQCCLPILVLSKDSCFRSKMSCNFKPNPLHVILVPLSKIGICTHFSPLDNMFTVL